MQRAHLETDLIRPVDVGTRLDRQRAHFAIHLANDYGVMAQFRYAPVLAIGERHPYTLYRALRRYGWHGQYVSVAQSLPTDFARFYKGDIYAYGEKDVPGFLTTFPPTPQHPLKEYSTAFIIDTLSQWPEAEQQLITNLCRDIAGQVVVVGAKAEHLRALEFQRQGFDGWGVWGVWFSEQAEQMRARMDILPESGLGYFARGEAEKRVWACVKCGHLDYTGGQKFKCRECGHENRDERKRYAHYKNEQVA